MSKVKPLPDFTPRESSGSRRIYEVTGRSAHPNILHSRRKEGIGIAQSVILGAIWWSVAAIALSVFATFLVAAGTEATVSSLASALYFTVPLGLIFVIVLLARIQVGTRLELLRQEDYVEVKDRDNDALGHLIQTLDAEYDSLKKHAKDLRTLLGQAREHIEHEQYDVKRLENEVECLMAERDCFESIIDRERYRIGLLEEAVRKSRAKTIDLDAIREEANRLFPRGGGAKALTPVKDSEDLPENFGQLYPGS